MKYDKKGAQKPSLSKTYVKDNTCAHRNMSACARACTRACARACARAVARTCARACWYRYLNIRGKRKLKLKTKNFWLRLYD